MVPYRVQFMTFLLIGGALMAAIAAKSLIATAAVAGGAYYGIRILTRN